MKGNSVQHRRKLGFYFAFRFVSVDARITVSKIVPSLINYRCFFLYHFILFPRRRKNVSFFELLDANCLPSTRRISIRLHQCLHTHK